jgi:hypothetical protein
MGMRGTSAGQLDVPGIQASTFYESIDFTSKITCWAAELGAHLLSTKYVQDILFAKAVPAGFKDLAVQESTGS